MKKNIVLIILSIGVGYLLSKFMFSQYNSKEVIKLANNSGSEYYFTQLAVYSNYENMINNTSKLDSYIYLEEDSKFYVFTCITRNKDNLSKIEGYFVNSGYTTYSKVFNLTNKALDTDIDKIDLLMKETTDNESIKVLCKESLTKYKEDK